MNYLFSNAIFQDGMNAIYLYFVNIVLDGRYWDFKPKPNICALKDFN